MEEFYKPDHLCEAPLCLGGPKQLPLPPKKQETAPQLLSLVKRFLGKSPKF